MTAAGIRIPGWVWPLVVAAFAVFVLGLKLGAQVNANDNRVAKVEESLFGVNFRLCRMERAMGIDPYQTCP